MDDKEITELCKDAERFRTLQASFDEGDLIIMHPDPKYGQLDSETIGLDEFADSLLIDHEKSEAVLTEMDYLDFKDRGGKIS